MANLTLLFFMGVISGIFAGFFGVGGGFFLTPVLNILGLEIVAAIGIGFFARIGMALMGAWKHLRLGNGHLKLGLILGLFSMGGVELGKRVVLYLESRNLAETSIRVTYIVILILISFFMLKQYLSQKKKAAAKQKGKRTQARQKNLLPMRIVSKIKLPPKIMLSQSELISVSLWVFVIVGAVIGFLSGLLGVGGGFLALPFLIYAIGVPAITAVGTSLIIVFFSSSYGAFTFSVAGHVDWTTGVIILAGSILGIQLGVAAVKISSEMRITGLFAILLLCIAVSVFFKQVELKTVGSYLVLSGALAICLIILYPIGHNFLLRTRHRKN